MYNVSSSLPITIDVGRSGVFCFAGRLISNKISLLVSDSRCAKHVDVSFTSLQVAANF